jgi:hypothetical protein
MKKIILTTILFCAILGIASAQNSYWVFFTDKQNTTFDPYQYFDAKAIERYALNGADLYDITNYPVNSEYASAVEKAAEELIGTSRWLNAAGVMATEEQISMIKQFPFVAGIQLIASDMELAEINITESINADYAGEQISIHHGELFKQHNISGKGVRVAVFDAGFPDVNTHPAFQHLRDNNQIIKTWNFVKKNENVYEANSHGRMVLSCIAGIMNGEQLLGMAPDAQFLLARTEVAAEPKKEEVWWVQALEWADQNGADIVNSSLGYGKQRYILKNMDGKTSMVAKAANTAAQKGILVCNSMGNEGTDKEWKMLITPADADSVLSVGAVISIDRIASFSSFGPTADGRMKPNVVAMGEDNWVAGSKGNFTQASGTSFSSPMMAGFAACVKQLHPEYTAWQLKTEIEKSANHYPYFDYAFGYGVPQAGYFFGEKPEVKDNLSLSEDDEAIYVTCKKGETSIFYKITNGDGTIERYNQKTIFKDDNSIRFNKSDLENGQTLEIWSDGQVLKYSVGQKSLPQADSLIVGNSRYFGLFNKISTPDNDIYTRKFKTTYKFSTAVNFSFMLPSMWSPSGNTWGNRISHGVSFDFDNSWRVARVYALGFRIGFGSSWYAAAPSGTITDYNIGQNIVLVTNEDAIYKKNIKVSKFDLEFVNRFILGYAGNEWWYLDAGIFGEWNTGSRYKLVLKDDNNQTLTYVKKRFMDYNTMNPVDFGVRMRVGITRRFAIFGQYRISNVLNKKNIHYTNDFPKWEIGIQLF